MKSYTSFITESSSIKIYHGDNHNTSNINPKFMFHGGNNQVGVGIYFGTLEVAKTYGSNIVSISINPKNFKDGNKEMGKVLNLKKFSNLVWGISRTDSEFWSIFTDYGIEIYDNAEVKYTHAYELYEMMSHEEIRNVQIELAQYCLDPVNLVNSWNRYITNIHGLYEEQSDFYSVIRTKYKVKQEK